MQQSTAQQRTDPKGFKSYQASHCRPHGATAKLPPAKSARKPTWTTNENQQIFLPPTIDYSNAHSDNQEAQAVGPVTVIKSKANMGKEK